MRNFYLEKGAQRLRANGETFANVFDVADKNRARGRTSVSKQTDQELMATVMEAHRDACGSDFVGTK